MFDLHYKWQLRTLLTVLMNTPERTPKHLSRYNLICTLKKIDGICKISMTFHLTGISKERMNRKLHGDVLSFYISSFFVFPFFSNIIVFGTFFKNCQISVFKEALNQVLLNILC